MKKIIAFFVMLVFTVTVTTGCFAAEPVTENNHTQVFLLTMQVGNPIMTVNGTESEIDPGRGTAPIIQNGRTLVPIRAIIEAMGGSVNWDEETQTVLLELEGDIITLTLGSTTAYFNETASTLDVAPVSINDRTMLPVRYIAESFRFTVDWDDETQTVTITKSAASDTMSPTAPETAPDKTEIEEENTEMKINVKIGDKTFTATLEDNTSAYAFLEMIKQEPLVIEMSDYSGFEKVGSLGTSLVTDDSRTTTQEGDIVLYNGNSIVIFYGSNTWSYTRLGKIDDLSGFKDALGSGDVTVTFSKE